MQEAIRLVQTIEVYMERALNELSPGSKAILVHHYGLHTSEAPSLDPGAIIISKETLESARREFSIRLEEILAEKIRSEEQRHIDIRLILGLLGGSDPD